MSPDQSSRVCTLPKGQGEMFPYTHELERKRPQPPAQESFPISQEPSYGYENETSSSPYHTGSIHPPRHSSPDVFNIVAIYLRTTTNITDSTLSIIPVLQSDTEFPLSGNRA